MSVKYAKENDKLVILGGAMGNTVMDVNAVKALADLPSLDELSAKLIGLLQAPATKIARILTEPGAISRAWSRRRAPRCLRPARAPEPATTARAEADGPYRIPSSNRRKF